MPNHIVARKIDIHPATAEFQDTIQNMGRFYAYDISEYMGKLQPGWEFPENGLYEGLDFSRYWQEPDRYPFLIRVEGELAGFMLINKIGSSPDVDWNMAEFYVVRKFTGQGVGKTAAYWCFKNFPGIWEVMQMPGNNPAICFWKKVIAEYTQGNFEESLKEIPEPEPHPMVVLRFQTT